LTVTLTGAGQFLTLFPAPSLTPVDAATLARQWATAHGRAPASVVLQFQPKTLAADLHRALLELQSAFGTNLNTILSTSSSSK
jgi:hypothetical protein